MIYYNSKTLNDAQLNYYTNKNDLVAVGFDLDKFRQYLLGSKVYVLSDHASLQALVT